LSQRPHAPLSSSTWRGTISSAASRMFRNFTCGDVVRCPCQREPG
jgi:hypothetical protein